MFGHRRGTRARLGVLALVATSLVVFGTDTLKASEAGPNGVNVGFDFSWDRAKSPGGYTASFLNADSVSLNNCGGTNFTLTSTGCNFVFNYKVAGISQPSISHSANWITWTKPTTYTLGSPSTTGCNSGAASTTAGGKAPVTLFDCFNIHSFGQIFAPTSTGRMSAMQFRMTCLVPWGANSLNLYAILYRLDDPGKLTTAPIAAAKLDLSTCPSALSWDGKTFSDTDFGWVEMPFKNVRLTANTFYGVYFAGNGVPGTPPLGAEDAIAGARAPSPATTVTPAPRPAATTSTTVPPTTTTVKKRTPKTTTTTTTSTTPPTTTTIKKKTPKTTTTSTTSTVPPTTTTTVAKKKTPKTTTTTTTVPPTTTTVAKKKTPKTTTTTIPPTTTTTTTAKKSPKTTTTTTTIAVAGDTYTALPATVKAANALRVVTPAEVDKTVLVSGTGSVCLPAGPYIVFMRPGTCKAYVVSRQTKGNLRVLTTRVLKSTSSRGESGLPIETLDPLYFEGGTAKLKAPSEKLLAEHARVAKAARAVLIVGYTGNLTFDKEAQTELARRRAAVTMVELQAAGVKGPFSLHMGGAENSVSNGTSVAEQDKNRRTIIILVP